MNTLLAMIGASIALVALLYFLLPATARVVITDDELKACAAQVALTSSEKDGGYGGNADAFIVDNGERPDFIAVEKAYQAQFGLDTVFTVYVRKGRLLCLKLKAQGKVIRYPEMKVSAGYHVTRSAGGSAALVKDGAPEPQFDCIEGYHLGPDNSAFGKTNGTGLGCIKND